MRILAGKLKGKRILTQKKGLRPTTSVLKASLFNIIGQDIIGKSFVDMFAGTGAIGFEAASRGAKEVVFVETNSQAVKFLQLNIENLQINGRLIRKDAFDFLNSLEEPFDYIFFSPPYDIIHWHMLLRAIENSNLMKKETLIIIQHPKMVGLESLVLKKMDERRYGFNLLTFYKKS